jgi:arylsulfatase
LGIVLRVFLNAQAFAQEVLPEPEPSFKGKFGRTAKESPPDFPKEVRAPREAPNVLLIPTDDVSFGASSTFGEPIQTCHEFAAYRGVGLSFPNRF